MDVQVIQIYINCVHDLLSLHKHTVYSCTFRVSSHPITESDKNWRKSTSETVNCSPFSCLILAGVVISVRLSFYLEEFHFRKNTLWTDDVGHDDLLNVLLRRDGGRMTRNIFFAKVSQML